jgi:hypothetical protein
MTSQESVVLAGETVSSNSDGSQDQSKLLHNLKLMLQSLVKPRRVAIKIGVTEIFQSSSELAMVIHNFASKRPKMLVTDMLVFNTEVSVGLVTDLANTARDQIENVT